MPSGSKEKKSNFPSKEEIKKVLKVLDKKLGSRMLPPDADEVDRIKFELCRHFIIYIREENLSQKDLAARLGINPSLINKILHYHFDEFTIDRLVRYLEVLNLKVTIKIA